MDLIYRYKHVFGAGNMSNEVQVGHRYLLCIYNSLGMNTDEHPVCVCVRRLSIKVIHKDHVSAVDPSWSVWNSYSLLGYDGR